MKKKFLTLLPLLFLMLLGFQSVNAQASYVSDTEAITILETQISDLSNELAQATPDTDTYYEIQANLNLSQKVLKGVLGGETVENALNGAVSSSSSTLAFSPTSGYLKGAYVDLSNTLSN